MKAQQLKNSILQMAIQGKLVSQDSNDEPASVLLEKIREERKKLAKVGKIKKEIRESTIIKMHNMNGTSDNAPYKYIEKFLDGTIKDISEEIPFDIPENWEYSRLNNVSTFGLLEIAAPSEIETNDWILDLEEIEKGTGKITRRKTRGETTILSSKNRFNQGQVLYCKLRPYLNKVVIADSDGYGSSEIIPISFHPLVLTEYAQLFLMSPTFVDFAVRSSYGTKMPRMEIKKGQSALVPIPPRGEQLRIVESIKQLLVIVDLYGKAEKELSNLNTDFPSLLKKSILRHAIQGRLVPQDPNDEPASVLLDRIQVERKSSAKGNKSQPVSRIIKRDNSYYEMLNGAEKCINEVIPYSIPDSWKWVRLRDIVTIQGGGTPDKSNPDYWNGNIPWASVKDIHGDYLTSTTDTITTKGLSSKASIGKSAPGDLIVATRLVPGKSIVASVEAAINQDLKIIKTSIDVLFLHFWFDTMINNFIKLGQGTTVPGIKQKDLADSLFPLPPLPEQHRIVSIIQSLFSMCDNNKFT